MHYQLKKRFQKLWNIPSDTSHTKGIAEASNDKKNSSSGSDVGEVGCIWDLDNEV